jgi:UDP-glucose 4-epimerase
MIGGKLLITGGTGSFGSTMVRRLLLEDSVNEIRIFSRDEKKQDDLRKELNSKKVKFYVGDVRDLQAVRNVVRGVDYVFHAAALKQVPSCDFFPLEAVKTNVLGTANVLTACKEYDNTVKRVVVLSTDKAVYPINAMGISKAMMEKTMVAESRSCEESQVFCGTRYGNVIASRGSVIPLFIKQIREKGEITITDPTMTRFLMSLDEASELVLFAFRNGSNGDMFVQKSPGATIEVLAKAVIRLLGKKEDDIAIRIIGKRHGEKMHESLVSEEDMAKVEDLESFYKIPCDNRDLNYNTYFSEGNHIDSISQYSSDSTYLMSVEEVVYLLQNNKEVKALVDGFRYV